MSAPGVYCDEDVDRRIVDAIGNLYPCTSVRQEGLASQAVPDETVFDYAQDMGAIFVIYNRNDFLALAKRFFERDRAHRGVLIVTRRRDWRQERDRILDALASFDAEEWRDRICIV